MNYQSTFVGLILGSLISLGSFGGIFSANVFEFLSVLILVSFFIWSFFFHKGSKVSADQIEPVVKMFTAKTIFLFFVPLVVVFICYLLGSIYFVVLEESVTSDGIMLGVIFLAVIIVFVPPTLKMAGLSVSNITTYFKLNKNVILAVLDTAYMVIAFALALTLAAVLFFVYKLKTGTLDWS